MLNETFFFLKVYVPLFLRFLFFHFVFLPPLLTPVFNLHLRRLTEFGRLEFLNVNRNSFTSGTFLSYFIRPALSTSPYQQTNQLFFGDFNAGLINFLLPTYFVSSSVQQSNFLHYCALYCVHSFKRSYFLALNI